MKYKTILISILAVLLCSTAIAETLSKSLSKSIADPRVYFSSAGPFESKNNRWRYRLSLLTMGTFPELVIEKVSAEVEYEGEGNYERDYKAKVAWSHNLSMSFDVDPGEFVKSFKWRSHNSFSFIHNKTKYIVNKIETQYPEMRQDKKQN